MPTENKTLDQERAAFAWSKTEGADDAFKALASGAPSLVMANGLMQALAFWNEKGKNEKGHNHKKLLDPVLEWLGTRVLGLPVRSCDFSAVMQKLHGGDADLYFRATEEALAILKWIRQFAKTRAKGAAPRARES